MALVLGTNTYVTMVEADAYFSTRIDAGAWLNAQDDDQESALVTATLLLDENQFIGVAVSSTQSLAWPRKDAIYFDPKLGIEKSVTTETYPKQIKMATYELALHLLTNENLLDNKTQTFERIKVGSIEIEDSTKDVLKIPVLPLRIKKLLSPLLVNGSGKQWWRAN